MPTLTSKRSTVLCREGWYYLFVLAFVVTGGLLRDINLLMVVASMMVGPLLYNWRSVRMALRGVGVERKLPKAICAGDSLVVDLSVTNNRRRDAWALVAEDTLRCVEGRTRGERTKVEALFVRVPAGGVCRQSYHGHLAQRGCYKFTQLRLSTRFPLGLVRHMVSRTAEDTVMVYPRLGRLLVAWRRNERDAQSGSRLQAQRRHGSAEGEFFGLRDWRPGDSRHWIHWRTSARRGALAVRQFEQPRNEDLLLIVELWTPASPDSRHLERVERAVSFAATIVDDVCHRSNSQLWFAVAGKRPEVLHGAASSMLATEIMERLAVVEGSQTDRLPELLTDGLRAMPSGTRAVIISTRPVDLGDAARFDSLDEQLASRPGARRILPIDVGSPELADYFQET